MADQSMPAVFERVLPLLAPAPEHPDFSDGYLDLLGRQGEESAGVIQSLWESSAGSAFYDHLQSFMRHLLPWFQLPASAHPPPGGRVLDVGCGPGNVTAQLGRIVGPSGLAVGIDLSRPMLTRAARTETTDNTGFVRADARRLPFADATFDLATSIAALQLIPEPDRVLADMVRALVPGGRLAVMAPTPRGGLLDQVMKPIGNRSGLSFFDATEVAEWLQAAGAGTVHTHRSGPALWITARRGG